MAVLSSFLTSAFSSEQFSYKEDVFTAEASDLHNEGRLMRQIYDDAIDVGIAIRSHSTGKVVKFYNDATFRDADGDVTYWTFKPTADHMRDAALAKLRVIIFND